MPKLTAEEKDQLATERADLAAEILRATGRKL